VFVALHTEKSGSQNVRGETKQASTVLVVDDDVIVRIVISDELRAVGFEVVEAGSGTEAVALLGSGKAINAVFSDISMPGRIDGLALARIIAERFDWVAVVLTSGSDVALEEAEQAKIPIVRKPYRVEQVISSLNAVLGGRQLGTREDGHGSRDGLRSSGPQ
jgi:two-component system, response regulator PdtaR